MDHIALSRIIELYSDKEYFKKLVGVGANEPPKFLREKFDEVYNEKRDLFRKMQMSRHEARRFAMSELNKRWEEIFESSKEDSAAFRKMVDFRKMASEAHQDTLSKSIEPEDRVKIISGLDWSIVDFDHSVLALPDCIALAHDPEVGILPAGFVANDQIDSVIFPLSPKRAVCAGTYRAGSVVTTLAENFPFFSAACSWDFVVTPPSYPEDWVPSKNIGDAMTNIMVTKIEEAIQESIADTLV